MRKTSAAVLLFMTVLAACAAPTAITGSWKKPGYVGAHPQKVAVLSLSNDKVNQAVVGEALAKALRARDVVAENGVNILQEKDIPEGKQGLAQREHLNALLSDQGFDLAITARLMDVTKSQRYVEGRMVPVPEAYPVRYYDTLGNYWYADDPYFMAYDPGYWVSTSKVVMETNVYKLPEGKLIWTGQSQTMDPSSVKDFSKSFAPTVVAKLFRDQVLK